MLKQVIQPLLKKKNMVYADLNECINVIGQKTVSNKVYRDKMSVAEFVKILNYIGAELIVKDSDGSEIKVKLDKNKGDH